MLKPNRLLVVVEIFVLGCVAFAWLWPWIEARLPQESIELKSTTVG